ncbi:MAG TPA: hypothetical protein VFN57_10915 [Thermomicrobiaceae bacterium]|nr:hypothetical protein [Thermomicrobiaceae bacterium]
MSIEDDLRQRLAERGWVPVEIEQGDQRLELHPVHGKLGAGFTLWERSADGTWEVRATGHTENGRVVDSSGDPLPLPREISDQIEGLLDTVEG